MAELLSMTLLSAEPVSAAKPQAGLSNEALTEPDQSFAATLAAEVNGKGPEKSAKAITKARQNTASELDDSKSQLTEKAVTTIDVKNDSLKAEVDTGIQQTNDEKEALSADADAVPTPVEQEDTEHSQLLNLLDKAKSLNERLTKAETEAQSKKEPALAQNDAEVKAAIPAVPAIQTELLKTVELKPEVPMTTAVQTELLKTVELKPEVPMTTAAQTEQSKTRDLKPDAAQSVAQKQGAVAISDQLITETEAEQHLTAEELNALKLMAQSDKSASAKTLLAESALKQNAARQKVQPEAEQASSAINKAKTADELQLDGLKDTGPDQSKILAHIEKPLKSLIETGQIVKTEKQPVADVKRLPVSETEKLPVTETEKALALESLLIESTTSTETVVNGKPQLQTEQKNTLVKTTTAAAQNADEKSEDNDSQVLKDQANVAEPKLSVQAQSAAALTAPVTQQVKTTNSDVKATTEEVLKQNQAASLQAQSEQGASSSSGESKQQGTAEPIINVIEQQKNTTNVASETNSFSQQLKGNQDKSAAGITVASRESISEPGQKQLDGLGQKLNLIQPEASNQLKEKMLMMVKDKVHTAEIRLDPSELGSMQIKINLQQDQMSVQFMVQQGNAKELMEQQMPKLKELLQQQGIELSQGSVQQQNQSSSGQDGGRRTAGGQGLGQSLDPADELIDPAVIPAKNSDRVVDYYA